MVALALWSMSCVTSSPSTAADVKHNSTHDVERDAAIAAARATLPLFLARLAKETEATVVYGARVEVSGHDVWLDSVMRRGERLAGIVDGGDDTAGGPVPGSVILVPLSAVIDWAIGVGDAVEGGYTLRLERSRLNEVDKAAFDAALGAPFAPLPAAP
jgi:uncharacterized protein YegJ (DUF2314 family)